MFLDGSFDVTTALRGTWNLPLVSLSVLIASLAAYVALEIAAHTRIVHSGRDRLLWLAAGATTMGLGVWAMHFVGMLAFALPVPVGYGPLMTAASILPAIIGSAAAMYLVRQGQVTRRQLLGCGGVMAAGIGTMHYSGMAAMRAPVVMVYDPWLFAGSLVVAFVLATAALGASVQRRAPARSLAARLVPALVMGGAVSGMHYTGMASVYLFPGSGSEGAGVGVDSGLLALLVAAAAVLLLGLAVFVMLIDRRVHAARRSEQITRGRMIEALESISEGFALYDSSDVLVLANTRFRQLFDAQAGGLEGRTFESLMRQAVASGRLGDPEPDTERWLSARLKQHVLLSGPTVERSREGRWFQVSERRTADGGVVAVYTDMTDLKEAEQDLRANNDLLSHELAVAQEMLREGRVRTEGVLLGSRPAADQLRLAVTAAAGSTGPVLVAGPTGSDHEAIARAIHHESPRTGRPFIVRSCLVPGDSRLTELFGRPHGSDVPDTWRLAAGGTLYLEGFDHLDAAGQAALLQLLDGPSGQPSADVHIVVSATLDLDQEVAAGHLRPDLLRRFTSSVEIPPLRTRIDDLPALVNHFLRRHAAQTGRPVATISERSLDRLRVHRWPGNLRELRNTLECALAASEGPLLEVGEHLLDQGGRVGAYTLVAPLGAGGMGEVWEANHHLLARPAAVKLIRRHEGHAGRDGLEALQQRFRREARATARLESPHTVRLYDFGMAENGALYYVMERLHGIDLQRMVERDGPLSAERTIHFLDQVCRSLSEAHAQGLIHRDIKPANLFACVLGSEFDFLKVLDFGMVALSASAHTVTHMTAAGAVVGTPAFLAPEMISGNAPVDHRADIYSFGCVAFWLLTGRLPFAGANALSMLVQHMNTEAPPPSSVAEQPIPGDLDSLVVDCLAKSPSERPESVDVVRLRLARVQLRTTWTPDKAKDWWETCMPEALPRLRHSETVDSSSG